MQLDGYAPCPCGSGKKIKFCCSKDILHDLDKVVRTLEGDQHAAGLELIAKVVAERGSRPALLSLQAETQLALQQLEEAEKTAHQLLGVMPHSTVGMAILAVADVAQDRVDEGVKHLQQSLENVDQAGFRMLYGAISIVANGLLAAGKVLAARGHFLMQAGLTGGQDRQAVEALVELNRLERLPTMLKQDFHFSESPPNAAWQGEFGAAMKSVRRGAWLAACESLESLGQKIPNQREIVHNIAILRSWLGQDEEASAAWRALSLLPGVAEDDAVDAEAFCQILSSDKEDDLVDVVQLTYPVRDTDKLLERLLSDKRFETAAVDPRSLVDEGQPPPKGVFKLLDRAMPASHEGLRHNDLPESLGDLMVFGKQTDREARLEFQLFRARRFEESKTKLLEVIGEFVEPANKEEVAQQVPALVTELSRGLRFPRDTTAERADELLHDHAEWVYQTIWPDLPRGVFDHKTAREAARDPKLRIRVLAAILNIELASEEQTQRKSPDFNKVRENLGLPTRGTYQVDRDQLLKLSISRFSRVDYSALSDDVLIDAFRSVALKFLRLAMRKCALEIIARPSLAEKIDLEEVYRVLVSVAADTEEALENIDKGRRVSVTKGHSPAQWHLIELQFRLARLEGEEANRLIKVLTSRHAHEPGVRETLYQLLVQFGVISQDGQVRRDPAESAAVPEPVGSASSQASQLWTPDSAAPKQESKLWLPGMQ